ncbi:MAG: DUF6457 domain-containing protein [Acidimicrobiales bacterium]
MDARDAPDAATWIARFAAQLGVEPPDQETFEALLALAAQAAHASERTAAPVACYLLGLTGRTLAEGNRAAAAASAGSGSGSAGSSTPT